MNALAPRDGARILATKAADVVPSATPRHAWHAFGLAIP